jgi:Protein of unknown function (DUF2911)
MKRHIPVASLLAFTLLAGAGDALAQERRPMSPRGTAATQVGGKWAAEKEGAEPRYTGGKWIEFDYGRPIKRGRESLFGSGAEYGKKISDGILVWRTGANQTTRLKTEAALEIAGKKIAPGEYSVFVELKEGAWTFVVSTQAAQQKYDPENKSAIWGSYGYDPKFDVLRAPMRMAKSPLSVDQFTIAFLEVTEKGGEISMAWDKELAVVHFSVTP